jgi:hypothetical protein
LRGLLRRDHGAAAARLVQGARQARHRLNGVVVYEEDAVLRGLDLPLVRGLRPQGCPP